MNKPGKQPFAFKVCPVCGVEKARSEYYKKGNTVSHKCKPCSLKSSKERASKYFGKYSERQNEWKRQQVANNPEYVERRKQLKKANYDLKKDEINKKRREQWANNPFCSARKHNRQHDVKQRQPSWVDTEQLLSFYANCPSGFHVDHIIPLKGRIDGRLVTGLHVPWNLQYLTAEENRKKYCFITESYLASIES